MLSKEDIENATIEDLIKFDIAEWENNLEKKISKNDKAMVRMDWYDMEEGFDTIKKFFLSKLLGQDNYEKKEND